MKNLIYFVTSLFVLVSFTGCNTLQVTTDYDKSFDFSKLKSYTFLKLSVTESVSEFNRERIIKSIKATLAKKGFILTDQNPDFQVNATAIIESKQSLQSNTYGYGGYYRPYGYGGMGGMGSTTTVDVVNYKVGSLFIDVVDGTSKKLLWEGKGNKEIDTQNKNPDAAIQNAVNQILYSFPPGANKTK